MLEIALNITPIFLIIALGLLGAKRGMFPPEFIIPANRLAFWIAVPSLIFKAVATAPLNQAFQPLPALLSAIAIGITWFLALITSKIFYNIHNNKINYNSSRASWIQCTMHGSQAYLGLAVIYYGLGQEGLNTVGLVAAIIIIVQNTISVLTITKIAGHRTDKYSLFSSLYKNPIILSSLTGLIFSISGFKIPNFIIRTLSIVGGLGLPLALLIIGATLSQSRLGTRSINLIIASIIKVIVLPGIGLFLMLLFQPLDMGVAVAVILLSSPATTVTVILAGQMGGDAKLASGIVTLTHALSALTYGLWLWLVTN